MIQLTRQGLVVDSDVEALTRRFEREYTLRLPQLFAPDLMDFLHRRMEAGNWIDKEHGKIGREVVLDDLPALNLLQFVVNTPEFLGLMREITGRAGILRYSGRVYRLIPGSGHYDSWHDDASVERLVGMSVNLGTRPYDGGVFQLRRKDSEEVLCELPNQVPGDAILFLLSRELVHQVTPVTGAEPKTAFAGWFVSDGENFFQSIR